MESARAWVRPWGSVTEQQSDLAWEQPSGSVSVLARATRCGVLLLSSS